MFLPSHLHTGSGSATLPVGTHDSPNYLYDVIVHINLRSRYPYVPLGRYRYPPTRQPIATVRAKWTVWAKYLYKDSQKTNENQYQRSVVSTIYTQKVTCLGNTAVLCFYIAYRIKIRRTVNSLTW